MNRRSLFGALAVLPFVGVAAKAALNTKPPEKPPAILKGFIRDTFVPNTSLTTPAGMGSHTHSIAPYVPPHAHSYTTGYVTTGYVYPATSYREIFDGTKFVPFDSAEGTAVLNSILTGRERANPA